MAIKKSNSVGHTTSLSAWVVENFTFIKMRIRGLKGKESELNAIMGELAGYAALYSQLTGKKLADAEILEIGYGARPVRLIGLISLGYNARGIDMDKPMLEGSVPELWNVYRKNGFKRFLKSFVRTVLFDWHERSVLKRVLQNHGASLSLDSTRFLVGDASEFEFPSESVDFIYSEDVFEHIPRDSMSSLCANLGRALSAEGVALISPAIFTSIAGGHLVEWYPYTLSTPITRKSEPWEHLRKKRFSADCYLNELRLRDYVETFQSHFHLEKIINHDQGMGEAFLTKMIRNELSEYGRDELLANKVTFVLRKKRTRLSS